MLIMHNDSDLYSSTLYALTMLNSLFVSGSVVIFDEFCTGMHEFRAFNDYAAAYVRKVKPVAMTQLRGASGFRVRVVPASLGPSRLRDGTGAGRGTVLGECQSLSHCDNGKR